MEGRGGHRLSVLVNINGLKLMFLMLCILATESVEGI